MRMLVPLVVMTTVCMTTVCMTTVSMTTVSMTTVIKVPVPVVEATVRVLMIVRVLVVLGGGPVVRVVVGGCHLRFPSRCGRSRCGRPAC